MGKLYKKGIFGFHPRAITFSPLVIVAYADENNIPTHTLRHEKVHVKQFQYLGIFAGEFPKLYGFAGLLNVGFHIWETPFPEIHGYRHKPKDFLYWAYYSNPFEIAAYQKEYWE